MEPDGGVSVVGKTRIAVTEELRVEIVPIVPVVRAEGEERVKGLAGVLRGLNKQ